MRCSRFDFMMATHLSQGKPRQVFKEKKRTQQALSLIAAEAEIEKILFVHDFL